MPANVAWFEGYVKRSIFKTDVIVILFFKFAILDLSQL